jgi:CheY-like chemotaxis protein
MASEFNSLRVLLVDDNDDVRRTIAAQMRVLGCEVKPVSSSWAALKTLSTDDPFDLLLTDIVLADGPDGLELARRAQRAFYPDLAVILMTGHSITALRELLGYGVTFEILPKPYRLDDLRNMLNSVLKQTRPTYTQLARNGGDHAEGPRGER